MTTKVLAFLGKLYKLIVGTLIAVTLFRVIEIIRLFIVGDFNIELLKFQLLGFYFDYFSVFAISIIYILPVFLLVYIIFNKNVYKKIFIVIAFLFFLLGGLFIEYFNNLSIPLDRTIFFYSIKELFFISKASSSTNIYVIISSYIAISIFVTYVTLIILRKINLNKTAVFALIFISFLALIFRGSSKPKFEKFESEINYYNSTNKIIYFIDEGIGWRKDKKARTYKNSLVSAINKYRAINKNKQFLSYRYPFYHKKEDKNVLGKYFEFKDKAPNIVILVVESLNKEISGPDAYYGSYTPFLDSLANNSLYWINFMSNAERTFGAMPSILGSLPYGKQGFSLMKDKMPNHKSLISILNNNSYHSNYFYAGWVGFHNVEDFLLRNNMNYILSESKFDKQYKRMPNGKAGWSWGYGDKELFDKSFQIIDSLDVKSPRLDVYMTLSSHAPWLINNQDYYENLVKKRLKEINLSGRRLFDVKINIKKVSLFMYVDDAIRQYFNRAKQTEWFDNTIFIITGDHRMVTMNKKSSLSKYHVPLIIYSPLLKEHKVFKGVSCHLDITPTILSLLDNNKFIKTPDKVHWIGTSLDTSSVFNSSETFTFMLNNKEVNEIVYRDYYLNKSILYKIDNNLDIEKINDSNLKDSVKNILEIYKQLDLYATGNNMLLPLKDYLNSYDGRVVENYSINFETDRVEFFNKKRITDMVYFGGSKSLLIKKNDLYQSVISKPIEFSDSMKKVSFFFSFMFYNKNISNFKKLPGLIYELKDEEGNVILWYNDHMSKAKDIAPNKWVKFVSTKQIDISKFDCNNRATLKIYLYNSQKEKIAIDDINSLIIDKTQ
jgi:uncharacterized sulfatase